MTRNRVFRMVVALLCAALAALTAAAAIGMLRAGEAVRAGGDVLHWIYTRQGVAAALAPLAPLFWGTVALALAGIALGVGADETPLPSGKRPAAERLAPLRPLRRAAAIRTALLLAAAVAVILGVANGGARDVLVKAVNICTECVGLG